MWHTEASGTYGINSERCPPMNSTGPVYRAFNKCSGINDVILLKFLSKASRLQVQPIVPFLLASMFCSTAFRVTSSGISVRSLVLATFLAALRDFSPSKLKFFIAFKILSISSVSCLQLDTGEMSTTISPATLFACKLQRIIRISTIQEVPKLNV